MNSEERDSRDGSGDAALVTRASEGDRVAIGDLLERHVPSVLVFVRLNLGARWRQRESCSDIVQSVCLELLENLDRFEYRGESEFRHWLCKAARNKIRQRDRYHGAQQRAPEREIRDTDQLGELYGSLLTPSQVAMANETWQRLEGAFDSLPDDYREVILLCRIVGLSQDAAAQRMGRTVDAVRNLLHRALVRLATLADDSSGCVD